MRNRWSELAILRVSGNFLGSRLRKMTLGMRGHKVIGTETNHGNVVRAMRLPFTLLLTSLAGMAFSQAQEASPLTKLTLDDVVRLTKERNGTIRAAFADLDAAKARSQASYSAFLPTVTPGFRYQYLRQETASAQFGSRTFVFDQKQSQIDGNWTFLDSGQRDAAFRLAKRNADATQFTLSQTVRQTLFNVQQQYYETLRAQELLKVTDSQVIRANAILEQTKKRVEVGDAARKDILQASADALNAQVNTIAARNRVANNGATLKASVGIDQFEPLPTLVAADSEPQLEKPSDLEGLFKSAMDIRPDLRAQRKRLEAQKFALKQSLINAGVAFNLDGGYTYQFSPNQGANQSLNLTLSYPLFDGGFRRANVRQDRATLESNVQTLTQAERTARAEIESAYTTLEQNVDRLAAAKAAVEAARVNYAAALGAQQAGASDLIEVLTAQVSLVTAESNYIEAVYDSLISDLRLKLVTGKPLPGE